MHFRSLRIIHWASVSSTALAVACSGADFQSVARGSDGGVTLDASGTGAGGSRGEDGGAASGNSGRGGSGVDTGGASNGGGSSGMFGSGGAAGNTASGGLSASGGSGTAGDGSGSGGQSSTAGGTSNAGGAASAGAGGAPGSGGAVTCTNMTTFYPDTDMDTFGRSTGTVVSCTAPPTGSWATAGGDCDDDDPSVFPKQPMYFAKPHSTSGGNHSYDYDCSGMEEGDPSQTVGKTCASLSLGGCSGSGYLSTTRTGMGVNPVCGSTSYSTCKTSGLGCAATTTQVEPYRCK